MRAKILIVLLIIRISSVFSQDLVENAPSQPSRGADFGYAVLGGLTSNLFLNYMLRLSEASFAGTTWDSMQNNWTKNRWYWEDGDRYLVNQLAHPYQGSTYYVPARVNGFNFYESIFFTTLGAVVWETLLEPSPSINDVITTTVGGVAMGEMLHRLFLEIDSSSIWGIIGGFIVSPMSSVNKIYNRPVRETGGGNIYDLSVKTGVEKTFAFFKGHQTEADAWRYPGPHLSMNVVYGDPFVQESNTPYEHFELYAGFTSNLETYNAAIYSDGYLFSFNPVYTETKFTSTGLSMHLDFFLITNDLLDNLGYGNIPFSSSALGWTVKHKNILSEKSHLEMKAHAALVFWGTSMYQGKNDSHMDWLELGNNRGTYGVGENLKLFLTYSHSKAGTLELAVLGYHIFAIPVTSDFSTGNVFFLYSSLNYEFPLGDIISIGATGTFWGLFGKYDSADNIDRRLLSNCLYVGFKY